MSCRERRAPEQLLAAHKSHVFSLIQKFNQDVDPDEGYTKRDDIIVITDEAHRTQYGTLALNMRNALPNASYIGFHTKSLACVRHRLFVLASRHPP